MHHSLFQFDLPHNFVKLCMHNKLQKQTICVHNLSEYEGVKDYKIIASQ